MDNVLIVDDDEDDRDLFCDAVNEVDSNIICAMARNGEEALAGLKSGNFTRPDIIFLELNMPRLNGIQCLRELKQDPSLHYIPVVVYSTSKLKEDREETEKLGAIDFITKPSSLKELCRAIRSAISKVHV